MNKLIPLLAVLLFFSFLNAQPAPQNISALTIPQIMQGEAFVGYLPENISWSEDSRAIRFSWNPEADTLRSIYEIKINADGTASSPARLSIEERKNLVADGTYNKDRTKKVFSKNGDLFLLTVPENKTVQVTNTLERESNPIFSGDGTKVIFQKKNNLFQWEIKDGTLTQLTDFKKGAKKKDAAKSGQDQWLYDDELQLIEVLAKRKEKKEAKKRQDEALKPERPKTYYFGSKRLSGLHISPDLRHVVFRLIDAGGGAKTEVPNYVTEDAKTGMIRARPKVGAAVDRTEIGIYDRAQDSIYFIDPTTIEGIFDKPDFLREYWPDSLPYEEKYESPRPLVFHRPVFSENGRAVITAKSQDNKDRWLLLLDLPGACPDSSGGEIKTLERQHDDAWIGGPGISNWNYAMGNIGWMPDNENIWFQSEETGYSHLYTLNVKTGKKKALTKGNFEILDAKLSNDKRFFYITSNKENPFENHFYKMPIKGGKMQKITSLPGNHQVLLSPDEKWLAVRYSASNKPWELYLMPNRAPDGQAAAKMEQLTVSTTPGFQKYDWRQPEIIHFTASDGVAVPARIYRPEASKKNGAAVIFVHGAGYLHNVHRWWSVYYREYMFHNLLVDNGFTVLDIDYRGSRGYGRDWRTAIYRHMGGKDLSDQVDGAAYLAAEEGIDAGRIGIYGGSYGGFITLMALFNSPGTFKCGAAIRSVTDWAHYNHEYTSNILNTPVEDPKAYRRSSPIYFAEGLQDHLLILHGMIDDNVHFQDVVRLSQRLIELGKKDWDFAVYPLERHGFVEPSSWTDEYGRIYGLFWRTLGE